MCYLVSEVWNSFTEWMNVFLSLSLETLGVASKSFYFLNLGMTVDQVSLS